MGHGVSRREAAAAGSREDTAAAHRPGAAHEGHQVRVVEEAVQGAGKAVSSRQVQGEQEAGVAEVQGGEGGQGDHFQQLEVLKIRSINFDRNDGSALTVWAKLLKYTTIGIITLQQSGGFFWIVISKSRPTGKHFHSDALTLE